MKILVVCQYYTPEPFRLSDICEDLVARGHEVTVVTGLPNYPMGNIYDKYKNGKYRDEEIKGVNVHRCFTIGRKHGLVFRFLNYYSYMFSSTKYISESKEEYDVVFVNQLSPVMMANAALKYKEKHNTKVVLYCLDLWPESITLGGVRRGSALYKYFYKVSKRIYKSVDRILVTSKSFSKYFEDMFGINDVEYLPQYAEAIFTPEECFKVPDGKIDLMFAGNVGVAQSIDTILDAAKLTADIKNLFWHIVGDGAELERLKQRATDMKLEKISFYGREPLEEMPQYYAKADAMLVTMKKDPIISLTLPGKVQTYMAAGKAIIGAIDGETKEVIDISRCGLCGKADDATELAENIKRFIQSKERAIMGQNARKYYEENFEKNLFMDKLESKF